MKKGYHGVMGFSTYSVKKDVGWWRCLVKSMIGMLPGPNSSITLSGGFWRSWGLDSTPINTRGYEALLKLLDSTANDSFDLYYGLFMYNVNAMEQLERLDLAFESLKKELFGQLHGVLRKQHFENPRKTRSFNGRPFSSKPNQDALSSASDSIWARNI